MATNGYERQTSDDEIEIDPAVNQRMKMYFHAEDRMDESDVERQPPGINRDLYEHEHTLPEDEPELPHNVSSNSQIITTPVVQPTKVNEMRASMAESSKTSGRGNSKLRALLDSCKQEETKQPAPQRLVYNSQ